MECSQDGGILPVNQILLNNCSNTSNDFVDKFGTRKAEVLNSLIINTTAKANDTTDILQTFRARSLQFYCYAQKMITVVIETFARCQLYRLLWP